MPLRWFLFCVLLARSAFAVVTCPPGATPPPTLECDGVCNCSCPGDADRNGFVNSTDFATVADPAIFGFPAQAPLGIGDANCDGFVNGRDYQAVQQNFGRPCPTPIPTPTP